MLRGVFYTVCLNAIEFLGLSSTLGLTPQVHVCVQVRWYLCIRLFYWDYYHVLFIMYI